MVIQHLGVLGDDSEQTEILSGGDQRELTRLVARLPAFGPIYRGFNQGNKERFWYACIIVSFLRSWYTLFQPKEDFESMMNKLCDHMESKGIWNPKAGGYVSAIGEEFCKYMNTNYPDKKIWMTRIDDGSSAMGGCIKRNIPVITAYYSGKEYNRLKSDGVINEEESRTASKGSYGHCVTFTGLGPLWSWREIQDNYEGREGNTYKVFLFPLLKERTWQKNCFFVILPQDTIPVPPSLRHKYV